MQRAGRDDEGRYDANIFVFFRESVTCISLPRHTLTTYFVFIQPQRTTSASFKFAGLVHAGSHLKCVAVGLGGWR